MFYKVAPTQDVANPINLAPLILCVIFLSLTVASVTFLFDLVFEASKFQRHTNLCSKGRSWLVFFLKFKSSYLSKRVFLSLNAAFARCYLSINKIYFITLTNSLIYILSCISYTTRHSNRNMKMCTIKHLRAFIFKIYFSVITNLLRRVFFI